MTATYDPASEARWMRSPLHPFQGPGRVVVPVLALIGQVLFGGWIAWAIAVLWFLLIVRTTLSGDPGVAGGSRSPS